MLCQEPCLKPNVSLQIRLLLLVYIMIRCGEQLSYFTLLPFLYHPRLFSLCITLHLLATPTINSFSFAPLGQHIRMFKLPAFWLEKHSEFLAGLSVGSGGWMQAGEFPWTPAKRWEEALKNQHQLYRRRSSRILSAEKSLCFAPFIPGESSTTLQVLKNMGRWSPNNAIALAV